MAVTSVSDVTLDTQIVTDATRSAVKGKLGVMGSVLVTGGAVQVSDTMPLRGRDSIGQTVRIPRWGCLGEFESLTEAQSPAPQKIKLGYEDATVSRKSIAFETSTWAKGLSASNGQADPYQVLADEAAKSSRRAMDSSMVSAGSASPMVYNIYSATTPNYLGWADVLQGKAVKLGDENGDNVAMAIHSLVAATFAQQTDANGRPLLSDPRTGEGQTVFGVPVIVSDRMPLTGSTMGTMTGPFTTAAGSSAGSGTATYTIAVTDVTKMGPWELVIEGLTTAECGTATIRFSTDGGDTWSAAITTAASGNATSLVDTTADSLVGNDGYTGVSITFTSGGSSADDIKDGEFYRSRANLCCESQLWMPGAGGYWYNGDALRLKDDEDILEDTMIGAMHLYAAAHVYRKRGGGSRPGVLRFKSNVRGFIG
jgi:hypothetical protein